MTNLTPAKSASDGTVDGQKGKRKSGRRQHTNQIKRRQTADTSTAPTSASSLILQRLSELDSRLAGLTDENTVAPALQISQSLSEQTQAIAQVGNALKSLQSSLLTAVTDAIEDQLRDRDTSAVSCVDAPETRTTGQDEGETALPAGEVPESSWDAIRSAYLVEHGEGDKAFVPSDHDGHAAVVGSGNAQIPIERDLPEADLPDIEVIADPGALNQDELRTAVIEQERTITMLLARLQKKSQARQRLTTEQLHEIKDDLPDELRSQVAESLKALDNQLRYGELELSLERARVSRQASQLEATRERLEARARSMGLEIAADGNIEGGDNTARRGSKARNWLGAMGFGN